MTEISPDRFRQVLGHLPTGVSVITAYGESAPAGMVANSVTSVSLDPPLILVCPARSSTTWPLIRASGGFCVNVMSVHQESISRQFSRKGIDRFADVRWHERPGGPGLDEAVAWIDCRIADEHDAGDHTIAVARVLGIEAAERGAALVFFRGRYGTFADGGTPGAIGLPESEPEPETT